MAIQATLSSHSRNVDDRAIQSLRQADRERKANMERIVDEYNALEERLGDTTRKYEASRARCTVLQQGNKKLKSQVKTVLKKTVADDEFVDALKKELAHYRKRTAAISQSLKMRRRKLRGIL